MPYIRGALLADRFGSHLERATRVREDPSRRSGRVRVTTPVRIRGICGEFEATAEDISLTGVRVRVARAALHLAADADLATSAATVQTRIGSRCVLELGLRQMGRALAKKVDLMRLALPDEDPASLDLGCMFESVLTVDESRALRLELPTEAAPEEVRRTSSWADETRPPLDPALTEEKVESLFDVETAAQLSARERTPVRPLRVILTPADGRAGAPLVCNAESFTESTVLVRVHGESGQVQAWLSGRRDLSEVASAVESDYGSWPEIEIAEGSRRLWRGGARVCGVEVGVATGRDVFLRFALGRRLLPHELERLCTAA